MKNTALSLTTSLSIVLAISVHAQNFSDPLVIADLFGEVKNFTLRDLNQDGFQDIITNTMAWHPNPLAPITEDPQQIAPYNQLFTFACLNKDTFPDLIYYESGDLYWRLGTSDPFQFGTPQLIGSMNRVLSIKVADLNGDGYEDIIIPQDLNNTIHWYQADDQYQAFTPKQIDVNLYYRDVTILDRDQDGDMDLIFLANDLLYLVENQPENGILKSPVKIGDSSIGGIRNYQISDLNHDGYSDLILVTTGKGLQMMMSRNGTEFEDAKTIDNRSYTGCRLGDLDQDGDLDIVGLTWSQNDLIFHALENIDGEGAFSYSLQIYLSESSLRNWTLGDMDNNGLPDIVGNFNNNLFVIDNFGWTGQNSRVVHTYQASDDVKQFFLNDVDGDHDPELILNMPNEVLYLVNAPNTHGRSYSIRQRMPRGAIDYSGGLILHNLTDLDGDGDLDLTFTANKRLFWREFLASEKLFKPAIEVMGGESHRYFFADWDQDGLPDIINSDGSGSIHVFLQEAESRFSEQSVFSSPAGTVIGDPRFFEVRDVDQDGDQDITFGSYHNGSWKISRFQRDGDQMTLIQNECTHDIGFSSKLADYDQDGDLDVLYSVLQDTLLRINRFDSDQGCFLPAEVIYNHLPTDAQLLEIQDVDQDGKMDIIYTRYYAQPHPIVILQQQEQGFNEYQVTSNKASPGMVIFQDLNNDKILDMLYLTKQVYHTDNLENEKLYLHYSQENVFSPGLAIYPGPPTKLYQQQWVDLDNDGDRDLLGFNEFQLVWYPNINAQGVLSQAIPLIPGEFYRSSSSDRIHVVDYDLDGDLDVILFRTQEKTDFYLLLNDGGTFTANLLFSWPQVDEILISRIDYLNHNERPDIVLKVQDKDLQVQELWLLKNENSPSFFSEPQPALIGPSADAVKAEQLLDLNQDGIIDLLSRDQDDNLIWFKGLEEAWKFESPKIIPGNIKTNLTLNLGDLDGDGFKDLVTCITYNNVRQFVWFQNTKDGLFSDPYPIYEQCGLEVRIIDFDQDGDMDIVTRGILYINTDGKGEHFTRVDMKINSGADFIKSIVDINGDGAMEIVSDNHYLVGAPGRLNFTNYRSYDNSEKTFDLRFIADVNQDGNQDIIFETGVYVYWLQGQKGDTNNIITGAQNFLFEKHPTTANNYQLTDLNKDGLPDIVANGPNARLQWYPGQSSPGTVGPPVSIGPSAGSSTITFRIADVDQDTNPDIVIHHASSDEFRWYQNLGSGGRFAAPITIGKARAKIFRVQDLDQNGTPDIIFGESSLSWMSNDGNGNFSEPTEIIQGKEITTFDLIDVNQDGHVDIIYKDYSEREINLILQAGNSGTFGPKQTLLFNADQATYWLSDLNNDLLPDLILQQPQQLRWRRGKGNGQFFPLEALFVEGLSDQYPTVWADMDRDEDIDMVYRTSPYNLRWRKNLSNEPLIKAGYFRDQNLNGQKDTLEITLEGKPVQISPLSLKSWTDSTGIASFYVSPGKYTLASVPDPLWELTTSSNYQVQVENKTTTEHFFGLTPLKDTSAIAIYTATGPTRCNSIAPVWFTFKNNGTRIERGKIKIILDSLTLPDSLIQLPDQQAGDTLIWEVNEWLPTRTLNINMLVSMPSELYTGESIVFKSRVELESGQSFEEEFAATIRCSYDPNDKLVNPNRGGPNYALFHEAMTYTIRFQNTGNDTAFLVTITDQLDEKLDWTTFQPVAASHDYDVSITEEGQLIFTFRNINLPDSTTNEPASHGYVQYTIVAKEWPTENEIISNTGNIYFDYNQAIITNIVENTLVREFPITHIRKLPNLFIPIRVYPNPAGSYFTLDLKDHRSPFPLHFSLYDAVGNFMFGKELLETKTDIPFPAMAAGSYYFKIENKKSHQLVGMGKIIHH